MTASAIPGTTRRIGCAWPPSGSSRLPRRRHAADDPVEQPLERVDELTSAVREAAIALQRQKLPRWFEGGTPFGMFVFDVGDHSSCRAACCWVGTAGNGLP